MYSARRRTGTYFHCDASTSGPLERSRAPHDVSNVWKHAHAVHAERVEIAVLFIAERCGESVDRETEHAANARLESGRRFPHTTLGVSATHDARDSARRREVLKSAFLQRVVDAQSREIQRGVASLDSAERADVGHRLGDRPIARCVDDKRRRAVPCRALRPTSRSTSGRRSASSACRSLSPTS
jgi:hypothetical protein